MTHQAGHSWEAASLRARQGSREGSATFAERRRVLLRLSHRGAEQSELDLLREQVLLEAGERWAYFCPSQADRGRLWPIGSEAPRRLLLSLPK